ncbi:MAG: hypothetical protein HY074_11340 [Deltaproteobacteria bacterium]|nr:hypothetical protein [Deltaproteobacteria bacterium]
MNKFLMFGLAALAVVALNSAQAAPASILHQTQGSVIVRLGADDAHVVWQEVGNQASEKYLYTLNAATGKRSEVKASKRPFAPAVAGDFVLYGAGHLNQKIDVLLTRLDGGRPRLLHTRIPWIVEPGLAVAGKRIRAVWERADDDTGSGLSIFLWESGENGDGRGREKYRVLASGPILRTDVPPEYRRMVHNEYPKIDGDTVVFQSNEYSSPNIYRLDLNTDRFTRLSPSALFQERPALSGPYTVWEESENGYAQSQTSTIMLHDSRTGVVKLLNAEPGFHYQARVYGSYALYGAKRAPLEHTPSIRIYAIDRGFELPAQKCFPGPVYDWVAVSKGVYVAQRFSNTSSRLLFATWRQLESGCRN